MRLNISHNYTTGSDEDVSETSDFLQPFSALLKRPMSNRPILAKRPILKMSDFLQQAPELHSLPRRCQIQVISDINIVN